MLLYAVFCIVIAGSSLGFTVLVGNNEIRRTAVTGPSTGAEEEGGDTSFSTPTQEAMNVIITAADSIMRDGCISARGVIMVQTQDFVLPVNITAKVKLNMDDLAATAAKINLDFSLNGFSYQIEAYYADGNMYLSALGLDIKMSVSGLTQFFSFVLSYLPGGGLHIDLPEINMNDLSFIETMMEGTEVKKNEDGSKSVTFNLNPSALLSGVNLSIPIRILTDAKGLFQSIDIDAFNAGDVTVSAAIQIDSYDKFDTITVENSEKYADADCINKAAASISKIMESGKVAMNADVSMSGGTLPDLSVKLTSFGTDFSSANDLKLGGNLALRGAIDFDMGFGIGQNTLYASLGDRGNLKLKMSFAKMQTGLTGILNLIEQIDPSLGISDLIGGVDFGSLADMDLTKIQGYLGMIKGFEETQNGVLLKLEINGEIAFISFEFSDTDLSAVSVDNLSVAGGTVSARIALRGFGDDVTVNVPQATDTSYVSLDRLTNVLNSASQILETKKVEMSGSVLLSGGNLPNLKIDLRSLAIDFSQTDRLLANGSLLLSGDVKMRLGFGINTDTVFARLGESGDLKLKLKMNAMQGSISALSELLKVLMPDMNFDLSGMPQIENVLKGFDTVSVNRYLEYIQSVSETESGFKVTLCLDGVNSFDILIAFGKENVQSVSVNGFPLSGGQISFTLNLNVLNQDMTVNAPSLQDASYTDMSDVSKLLNSAARFASNRKIALDGRITLKDGANFKNLTFDLTDVKLDLSRVTSVSASDLLSRTAFTGRVNVSGDIQIGAGLAINDGSLFVTLGDAQNGLKMKMAFTSIENSIKELLSFIQYAIPGSSDILGGITGGISLPSVQLPTDLTDIDALLSMITKIENIPSGIAITFPSGGKQLTLNVEFDTQGISAIWAEDIYSQIDGSLVDFRANFTGIGDEVTVNAPSTADESYLDFNSVSTALAALNKTARLTTFDLNAWVSGRKSDGTPTIYANPQLVVDLKNGLQIGGSVDVKIGRNPNDATSDYKLGLWYDHDYIYADAQMYVAGKSAIGNIMRVKLNVNSTGDILTSVIKLIDSLTSGGASQSQSQIAGIIESLSKIEFEQIASIIKDLRSTTAPDGTTTIEIELNASLLYENVNPNIPSDKNVTAQVIIDKNGYLSAINVQNIYTDVDELIDFSVSLDHLDAPENISMPRREAADGDYIDLSGLAPVITAVQQTGEKNYFYITGKMTVPQTMAGVYTNERQIELRVDRNAQTNKVRLALSIYYSYTSWFTKYDVRNTLYYEFGANEMYASYFEIKQKNNSAGNTPTQEYKTIPFSSFSSSNQNYIQNICDFIGDFLEFGLINTIGGMIPSNSGGGDGGNTIDYFNVLKGMTVTPQADGGRKVATVINICELAGTSVFSDPSINIYTTADGYIRALDISNFKILSVFEATVSLSLDLTKTTGDAFADTNLNDAFPDAFNAGHYAKAA